MLITEKFLICDGCSETYGADARESTGAQHRKSAHEYDGWVYIQGKDYCGECKPNKTLHLTAKQRGK
uniref:Uncharacterized protein n=1 Tax=viral metagenome TaxID=1070528 RepID=A0A6M3JMN0_9ZZZZ